MTYISRFVTGMRAKVRYEVLGDNKESRETGDSLKNYQKEGRKFKCLQSDNKLASKGLYHPGVGVQKQDTIGGRTRRGRYFGDS